MQLCLFDAAGGETRVPLVDYDAGVWHAFVPGVGVGQRYGYRAGGTYDPDSGLRFNSEKLLLDPYARSFVGEVSYGPEVLGYAADNPDAASPLDSAGHVPRSIVLDDAYEWGNERPSHRYADTVIYEVHVKGFTARNPDVPAELRGTYAGLGHEAAINYLLELGVTAVELLPVHESVPESFLAQRGLTITGDTTRSAILHRIRPIRRQCALETSAARSGSSRRWSTRCIRLDWRCCSTSSSITRPREINLVPHCAIGAWTTRPITAWTTPIRVITWTRRAAVTRSMSGTQWPFG